jgi:hypothetical protein
MNSSGILIDEEFIPFIAGGNDFEPAMEYAADNDFLALQPMLFLQQYALLESAYQ